MPRIPHSLLLRAHEISPFLPLVLRATRTLPSALNELRWLAEHVQEQSYPRSLSNSQRSRKLLQLCKRRERGEPLQYILGSQPFGELDIKCRPGVLIPRPETEAYTTHVAKLLLEGRLHKDLNPERFMTGTHHGNGNRPADLKILDLCSGSGCISLLLYSLLSGKVPNIKIRGYDISATAHKLSVENLRNVEKNHFHKSCPVEFHQKDIFSKEEELQIDPESNSVDIIISNPPYITLDGFNKRTSRSVRNWEPKTALVPTPRGPDDDGFLYHRLLQLHQHFCSKVLVMEVAGETQARLVADAAREICYPSNRIEIWRDWPDQDSPDPDQSIILRDEKIPIRGNGNVRAVVLLRKESSSTPTTAVPTGSVSQQLKTEEPDPSSG